MNSTEQEFPLRLPLYQVDAFTARRFHGNPAAVVLCDTAPAEAEMQAIAAENNLSETAFVIRRPDGHHDIRWFTPVCEVDLCGHATLAAAHVLFTERSAAGELLRFHSKSDWLGVRRQDSRLELDFPAARAMPVAAPDALLQGLGLSKAPRAVQAAEDWLVELDSAADVVALAPDMALLATLPRRGVIVTAPGQDCDFVSRFFAPRYGIPEDPVTGSAHCLLTPYWAARLGKHSLHARQISARGGELFCTWREERVLIAGDAVTYLRGEITI